MRIRFPRSPLIRLSLRLNIVVVICALTVGVIAFRSFAQKRTAVRVSPNSTSTPAKARKSERERERERDRARFRQTNGTLQNKKTLPYPIVSSTSETTVRAEVGAVGVQRQVGELMKDQAMAPEVERTIKLMPEFELPDRRGLPQDPNSRPVASTPADNSPGKTPVGKPVKGRITSTVTKSGAGTAADTIAPTAPQTVGTPNFTAATLADTGAFPPDTMGAIGPSQFVAFENGRVRTFNKTTGVADGVINADSDVFFASVMTPLTGGVTLNFTSDPQVRYDRLTRRWFLTIIDVPGASLPGDKPNRILIAVSDAASNGVISGSTVFTFYFVQQDTVGLGSSNDEFLDYDSLGIDNNALYVGGNMFGATSGDLVTCSAFVIQKASVLSGGPLVVTAFRGLVADPNTTDGMLTPRGVDNFDPASNEGYLIGVSNAAFGRLIMRRISNPGSMAPTISADFLITVSSTAFPISVAHLGNTGGNNGRLDALDDRIYAAHIRNGRLWAAHNIGVTATGVAGGTTGATGTKRDAVRWYELNGIRSTDNGGTPVIVQSGTIFDTATNVSTARQFWIPTVMVSGQGHAAFGFSTAGTTFRADAATNGRLRGDALGTTGAVALYTASSTAYNPPSDIGSGSGRRWGDYSFVSLDPKDDMTMWAIQQFCSSTNIYGVQVVRLLAPLPATPATSSVPTISAGVASTNITITGTSVSGSEFYDPGTDIAGAEPFNHITASVSGGVTVNSVTYVDTTHVTLNVSTVGATVGTHNVTITNPDGQSMTGNNLFSVNGTVAAGALLISEFRLRGPNPNGAQNEFIELYNPGNSAHTVGSSDASAGYGVAASDGVLRCTIPNGTVIPAHGHFLCTNSVGYSLAGYATGDATFTTDIPDNAGIGLFSSTTSFVAGTKLDAVGSTSEANALYKEGTGYPVLTPFSIDYSFRRDDCGKQGSITTMGACPSGGDVIDTNNNASDFYFVDTNGTSAGAGQRLGAPGPENLASPINRTTSIPSPLLDVTVSAASPPNRVRDFTSDPANNSTFGTLDIRRRFINNTGASVTRLRFRVIDLTTFPAPSGIADLRPRTSTLVVVSGINDAATCLASNGVATTPCTVNVQGSTLEQPPSQLNGGGFGSTYSAGTVTLGTPLANGASINVRFLLGIQQTGSFKFFVNVEALP
jgi:hypothetical protein